MSLLLTAIKAQGGVQPHAGDANNDGYVDVGDLGVLAFNWGWVGSPAGAGNVPEPVSLTLLALGGVAMLRHRRKY